MSGFGVKVKPFDGDQIELDADVLKYIHLLQRLVEDEDVQNDNESTVIALDRVSSKTLQTIVDWCKLHADGSFENVVNKDGPKHAWTLGEMDREFFENHHRLLNDLMRAAQYLEFGELMEAASIYLAEQLRGKTVEEIRNITKMK